MFVRRSRRVRRAAAIGSTASATFFAARTHLPPCRSRPRSPRYHSSPMATDAPDRRCLCCGYVLDKLPTSRCPECGRAFDLNDPTSFRGSRDAHAWTPGARGLAALASGHLLILSISTFDVGLRIPGEWYPLGACAFDGVGQLTALTAPVILFACMLSRRGVLLWLGWTDLLLAIIWVASLFRLMRHL